MPVSAILHPHTHEPPPAPGSPGMRRGTGLRDPRPSRAEPAPEKSTRMLCTAISRSGGLTSGPGPEIATCANWVNDCSGSADIEVMHYHAWLRSGRVFTMSARVFPGRTAAHNWAAAAAVGRDRPRRRHRGGGLGGGRAPSAHRGRRRRSPAAAVGRRSEVSEPGAGPRRRHLHRWRRPADGPPHRLDIQLQPPSDLLLRHTLHHMQVADLGPLGTS